MFDNCTSLTSLNLNDFGKVKLLDAGSIFHNMESLISINLSNFDMSEVTDIGGMFWGCSSLKSLDLSNFYTDNINVNVSVLFSGCINLEYINLKNARFQPDEEFEFISGNKNVVFCNKDERIVSKVKNYGCIVIDCSENWQQNPIKISLDHNKCVNDCSETNKNKYNYKDECLEKCPDGTYNNYYKCLDCHHDCKTCEKAADIISTNCNSCNDSNKYFNYGNCYMLANSTLYDKVIENIQESLINNFDTTSIDNGSYHISTLENITYRITTTKNRERQKNDSITTIDLGECANNLKGEYNLSFNENLYILMIDMFVNNIEKVEYKVYYNFSSKNLTKLNLTSCKDTKIAISIPRDIPYNENDKYNKSSGYYNDICYTLTSESGTDKPLKDRQDDYNKNNLSLCEEG